MKFTFIGEEPSVTIYGITFKQGVPKEVAPDAIATPRTKKHPAVKVVDKLKGHPCFESVEVGRKLAN